MIQIKFANGVTMAPNKKMGVTDTLGYFMKVVPEAKFHVEWLLQKGVAFFLGMYGVKASFIAPGQSTEVWTTAAEATVPVSSPTVVGGTATAEQLALLKPVLLKLLVDAGKMVKMPAQGLQELEKLVEKSPVKLPLSALVPGAQSIPKMQTFTDKNGLIGVKPIKQGWPAPFDEELIPEAAIQQETMLGDGVGTHAIPTGVTITGKATHAPPIQLKFADKLLQPVRGTSPGSIYWVVGLSKTAKMAMRWEGSTLSVRVEGIVDQSDQMALTQFGFKSGVGYMSMHVSPSPEVSRDKMVGAVLLGCGLPFNEVIKNVKELMKCK